MDKQTLRRIGWVGASLGLTSVLVGCSQDLAADSGAGAGTATASSAINANNGFLDPNGFNGNNGFNANNGFNGNNGFNVNNGFNANNGLNVTNGLNIANGLNANNGLYPNTGYMTSEQGRSVVNYLARCALGSGDSLVKQDQYGNNFTFAGGLGLYPAYKTAGCGKDCSEILSACMMAHINSSGTHIPLWMDSPDVSGGWGTSPAFPTREGTFFGQMMLVNAGYNLDAYYCNGPGADKNLVPGRLGDTTATTYVDAWPVTAGFDGQCEGTHINNFPSTNYDHGKCIAHSTNGVVDGDSSCTLNGVVWSHPLTVWRGATYQAEAAEGGAWSGNNGTGLSCLPGTSGCVWVKGALGFNAGNCTTPGANGCSIINDSSSGMGQRVGYFTGGSKGLKFTNVASTGSGKMSLVVYYTNGDPFNVTNRYFQFVVNGSAPQTKAFGGLADWSHPRGASIVLDGFVAGSTNTVWVTGDAASDGAPDLDWIEVLGTDSSLPTTGECMPSAWNVTASVGGGASAAVDGSLDTANAKWNPNMTSRWSTGRPMAAGDYYQVDFMGPVKLSTVTLNNNYTSNGDFPGQVAVYTSQDGVTFSTEPVSGIVAGTNNQTTISFPQETLRAIRVQVVTPNSNAGLYWSIGQLDTDCKI